MSSSSEEREDFVPGSGSLCRSVTHYLCSFGVMDEGGKDLYHSFSPLKDLSFLPVSMSGSATDPSQSGLTTVVGTTDTERYKNLNRSR